MKKSRLIFRQVKALAGNQGEELQALIWPLICYSPKIPLRLQQEQLLAEASKFSLPVFDPHFTQSQLIFHGFKWGNGKYKVLLTHGWGSKAADFFDLIVLLREINDLEIIAFDAPGNGSSEAELSNLLLYVQAAKTVIETYGVPHIVIGHSLGAMANIIALQQTGVTPSLLISLAPLIRLKENFMATLAAAEVAQSIQDLFFERFEAIFNMSTAYFNWDNFYHFGPAMEHRLAHTRQDLIAPYAYLDEFLTRHPEIDAHHYDDTTHERMLKEPAVIADVVDLIKARIQ